MDTESNREIHCERYTHQLVFFCSLRISVRGASRAWAYGYREFYG